MSRSLLLAVFVGSLALGASAWAFDPSSFRHTPPERHLLDKTDLLLSFSASQVKRARVLLATSQGYQATEMEQVGDRFVTRVNAGDLTLLKYQFQIEGEDGALFESSYYNLKKLSSAGLSDDSAAELGEKKAALDAKIQQLESALFTIKSADPAVLAKRKTQERAQALLNLSQKQRELEALRAELTAPGELGDGGATGKTERFE
ncbi:MAG: hypothetical protein K1X83_00940 [Oligoflexia bacterium]|nr:hypothetical protein [Oligoflexia bacterium]